MYTHQENLVHNKTNNLTGEVEIDSFKKDKKSLHSLLYASISSRTHADFAELNGYFTNIILFIKRRLLCCLFSKKPKKRDIVREKKV